MFMIRIKLPLFPNCPKNGKAFGTKISKTDRFANGTFFAMISLLRGKRYKKIGFTSAATFSWYR